MSNAGNTMRRTAALAVAGLLTLAACGSGGDGDESAATEPTEAPAETAAPEPVETTEPAPATTEAAPATTSAPATTAPPTTAPAETAPPTTAPAGGGLLEVEFQELAPGDYRVETLGAPFTISIPEGWWVQPNSLGHVVFTDERSQGPGDLDIVMIRPSNLADPDDPGAPREEQDGDWPLDDIEGWLASLVPGIVSDGPEATTLGGLDATRFDVLIDDAFECGPDFCVGFATNRAVNDMWFDRRIGYRVWWIDGGDESPIAVFIGDGGDPTFTERAEAVLDTLVFESIGPNPVPQEGNLWEFGIPAVVPAGTVTLPAGPGVTFELVAETFVFQDDTFVAVVGDGPFESDIDFPEMSASGAEITTAADVVAALEETDGVTIESSGTRTVDGREAVEVTFAGPEPGPDVMPVFASADDPMRGWRPPLEGVMWIVELDEGVGFVTAEALEPGFLEEALAFAEPIVDSITFGS